MFGKFNEINVVETLISFACAPVKIKDVITPELKKLGNKLYLIDNEGIRHILDTAITRVANTKSPWTQNFEVGQKHELVFSHGEGRLAGELVDKFKRLAAFQYIDEDGDATLNGKYNVNGSLYAIEGMISENGLILGKNVHMVRKNTGRILAKESPVDADIVVGVPNSSLSLASGYAEEIDLPYEMGLIKNQYMGRTFIQPTQNLRDLGVKMKLSALSDVIRDKRVVLLDDSIVRGTTSRRIVDLLKDAVAEEICKEIGADSLEYLSLKGLQEAIGFNFNTKFNGITSDLFNGE